MQALITRKTLQFSCFLEFALNRLQFLLQVQDLCVVVIQNLVIIISFDQIKDSSDLASDLPS